MSPDADERQRKSRYTNAMQVFAEEFTGETEIVPFEDSPLLARAARDIERWWPQLKDREDRNECITESVEATRKKARYKAWEFFRACVDRRLKEPAPAPVAKEGGSHCHIHGWYPLAEMAAHTDCSYDEGEPR